MQAKVTARDSRQRYLDVQAAMKQLRDLVVSSPAVHLAGNGGSAAICSHISVDYCKYLRVRARSLTDPSMLTCIANDYGYEFVFSKQLEWFAQESDLVVLVSSSGESRNVLEAANLALSRGLPLVTFSAFKPQNSLSSKGVLNFHVETMKYGEAEVEHLRLLHSLVDV